MDDATEDEINAVMTLVVLMKDVLQRAFGAEGFNVAWNEGDVGGQSVPHFHLHVLPRKPGDIGIHEYEPREFLYRIGSRHTTPEDELSDVAQFLKSFLPTNT